jgi:DNA-binding response OmpR family regulator
MAKQDVLRNMATILIVDDDEGVRATIVQALKVAGHEVFSASNGKEGMRHIRAIQPDLIITDLFMPEQEGLETITELHDKFPQVAILAISGGSLASPAMLSVALQLGATDILEKPFDNESLLAAVGKILRKNYHRPKPDFHDESGTGPILPESH